MSFSPTNPRIKPGAFTLVEMMVAASVFSVVGFAVLSVLLSTMQLSSENVAANLSNFRARQVLDHVGEVIRYAQDTPVLINADGTAASGNTADGVLIKNALGGPYVFKNSNGKTDDIPVGTTRFMVEYAPSAGMTLPEVGDYFLVNLSTQPELEVLSVTPATSVGLVSRAQITTRTGLTEVAQPDTYTVNAARYRKEAYTFVQSGSQWSLRHHSNVTSTTVYTDASSYTVLGTGFQRLGSQAWFNTVGDNGTQAFWLRAVARSSDQGDYIEYFTRRNSLTSMPVQSKLWNYHAPPPAN